MTKLEQKQKELIRQLLPYFNGFGKEERDVYHLRTEIAELEKQPITDADIEAWADEQAHDKFYQNGMIRGAKAMRDGDIKHVEKGLPL